MKNKMKKIVSLVLVLVTLVSTLSVMAVSASAASIPDTDYTKYSVPSSSDYAYWNGKKMVKASGTTKNELRWIQTSLNKCILEGVFKADYLTIDANFGPACKKATIAFQRSQNLTPDGSFGSKTIAAMKEILKKLGTENNATYELLWPTNSTRITGKYGTHGSTRSNGTRYHSGIDIGSAIGDPCYAVADGVVVMCKATEDSKSTIGGRGRYIVIYHSNGDFSSLYEHLDTVSVKVGDKVTKGQKIGTTGNSGWVSKNKHYDAHLHFGLIKGKMTTTGYDLWTVAGKKYNGKTYTNHTFEPDPNYNKNILYTYKK